MSFSINLENGEVSNVPGQQQMRKGKLKMREEYGLITLDVVKIKLGKQRKHILIDKK